MFLGSDRTIDIKYLYPEVTDKLNKADTNMIFFAKKYFAGILQ